MHSKNNKHQEFYAAYHADTYNIIILLNTVHAII